MPGMMETILNLGLNDRTVEGLAQVSKNPRFAWDCYRRFVAMYGGVVLELNPLDRTAPVTRSRHDAERPTPPL